MARKNSSIYQSILKVLAEVKLYSMVRRLRELIRYNIGLLLSFNVEICGILGMKIHLYANMLYFSRLLRISDLIIKIFKIPFIHKKRRFL